jgi:hypothetical protein
MKRAITVYQALLKVLVLPRDQAQIEKRIAMVSAVITDRDKQAALMNKKAAGDWHKTNTECVKTWASEF